MPAELTRPVRNGEIASDGIVYIGDGNWGWEAYEGNNRDAWYIKKFARETHGIIVTLSICSHPHQATPSQGMYLLLVAHGVLVHKEKNRPSDNRQ